MQGIATCLGIIDCQKLLVKQMKNTIFKTRMIKMTITRMTKVQRIEKRPRRREVGEERERERTRQQNGS